MVSSVVPHSTFVILHCSLSIVNCQFVLPISFVFGYLRTLANEYHNTPADPLCDKAHHPSAW